MAAVARALAARSAAAALGVSKTASAADARLRFLALSKALHPDLCDDPRAADAFRRLADAYREFDASFDAATFDPGQAEFQGDALTTAGWLYESADAARRRDRAARTLGAPEQPPSGGGDVK